VDGDEGAIGGVGPGPPATGHLFQLGLGGDAVLLGLDGQDNDGNARKFLSRFPVTYPSYKDPDLKISTSIQAGIAFPTTIFIDRKGKIISREFGLQSRSLFVDNIKQALGE